MMRLARMMGSAALCALALNALPHTAAAADDPPAPAPAPAAAPAPANSYIPQGARVFPDGKTMLYDQSGSRGNVTPDSPRIPDATAKDSTNRDSASPDAPANNSGGGGATAVKHWQRPPAPPEVIAAWIDKCNPVSYEDSEHIKRVRFSAKDCDLTDPRQ